MTRLPTISGFQLVKALKKIGFRQIRQKGSHVVVSPKFPLCFSPEADPPMVDNRLVTPHRINVYCLSSEFWIHRIGEARIPHSAGFSKLDARNSCSVNYPASSTEPPASIRASKPLNESGYHI